MQREPGLHDPFWYEATLAESFIIDMLNPDNGIQSVTIQAPGIQGIDDVVVKYAAKPNAYYQIKHTRVANSISVTDLVSANEGKSLLQQLGEGWADVTRIGGLCETHLFTNREMTVRSTRNRNDSVIIPSLSDLWQWLQNTITKVDVLDNIHLPEGWEGVWHEWLAQLDSLSPAERLLFLQSFHLHAAQPDLPDLDQRNVERLANLFGIPKETAENALAQLDRKLREWATSQRGDNVEITPERAWSALAFEDTPTIRSHAFTPPAPFFPSRLSFMEDLAAEIRATARGIIFLTGPAGCGKSSIVSALANRLDPVVDLRFYAFRPLTPYDSSIPPDFGRSVTAAALWGDLLAQLRTYFFCGRLWSNQVPVRNDFLLENPERLREHVLILAAVLAKERQRPTVIAIDGLDHAARAHQSESENFAGCQLLLTSLVPPDAVPEGIVFLIAGQSAGDAYPIWLRTERPDIRTISVPSIGLDDIVALLHSEPGKLAESQIDSAARVIRELTRGNTLAAVYAVAEARTISDVIELQSHLEHRRLGTSLEQYYDSIWSAALESIVSRVPSMSNCLATALSLSTARLDGHLLTGFFPDVSFSSADWEAVLEGLAPIVNKTAGTYAILHNDLRVFLMARLTGNRTGLVNAASAMSDYYLSAGPSIAKYKDLFRLLNVADRKREISGEFSPEYVVDGITLQIPIVDLEEQAKIALASVTENTGWESVHDLALGISTLQQARVLAQYYEFQEPVLSVPPCLISEARVIPRGEWSLPVIEHLLDDAQTLLVAGEQERARALFSRWLDGIAPVRLSTLLKESPGSIEPWEENDISNRISVVLQRWGDLL